MKIYLDEDEACLTIDVNGLPGNVSYGKLHDALHKVCVDLDIDMELIYTFGSILIDASSDLDIVNQDFDKRAREFFS